ncbi:MAG: hypothetical protein ACR2KV_03840 [Solirubrobacteraceae bacterium]
MTEELGEAANAEAAGLDPTVVAEEHAAPDAQDPYSYAPDPAGTRPKVPMRAVDPEPASGGALGQTFRATPPAPEKAAGRPASPAPAAGAAPFESPHAPRFQFILGALLALGLSAVAITAYTLSGGRDALATDWSAWHPSASGTDAAAQIANHVAAEYRQPVTGQLLAVKGGPLILGGLPVTIAIKTGVAAAGGISVLSGNAISYKMCGLGPSCTLTGTPSPQRLMLLRREALELALYTFQYVGADQVVVFLPPVFTKAPATAKTSKAKKAATTVDTSDAVFFRSGDLAAELSHPLDATLTPQTPSVTTVAQAPDTPVVAQLTTPSFYKFSFIQTSQDASLFLVLQPFLVGN